MKWILTCITIVLVSGMPFMVLAQSDSSRNDTGGVHILPSLKSVVHDSSRVHSLPPRLKMKRDSALLHGITGKTIKGFQETLRASDSAMLSEGRKFTAVSTSGNFLNRIPGSTGPGEALNFSPTPVPPSGSNSLIRNIPSPDWIALLFLVSLGLLVWARRFYGKYYSQILLSLTDYHLSQLLYKDRNVLLYRISQLFLVNFVVVGGVFLYQLVKLFHFPTFFPGNAILILWLIPLVLLLYHGTVNRISGFIFDREAVFEEYNHHVSLFYKSLGILLLPLIIGSFYLRSVSPKLLVIVGLVLIILTYTLRIVRGLRVVRQHHVSVFYSFLYFCTFEILPFLLVFKLIHNSIG